jgi:glucose-6-phosphate 1-dehydrogenase
MPDNTAARSTASTFPSGPDAKAVPEPFTLVIFGASGDLAHRKLLPAVFGLWQDGLLPPQFSLLGYARSPTGDDEFRRGAAEAVAKFTHGRTVDPKTLEAFASRLHYAVGGYDDLACFQAIRRRLEDEAAREHRPPNTLFYLATPPEAFGPVVRRLGESGLSRRGAAAAPWSRVVIEKPFGSDLASARTLNGKVRAAFKEHQVFRIDHYLGKETVQNILVLRFANSIFEPLWNYKYVDHVQITVAESGGVEQRGPYYDHAGAVRDIMQNHMMQLVCLVAMESPLSLAADSVRDEKVKVLRALRPIPAVCGPEGVIRAQYAAGEVRGKQVQGYLREPGVAPDSTTETYAAMRVFIDNWRWSGVPFYLRTGKRMAARVTEIAVRFKPIPQVLFGAPGRSPVEPNTLAMRIQPNEGITLRFQVKVPGPAMQIEPFQMDFGYAEVFERAAPEAYERLLLDAAHGDPTLFARGDEIEAAWTFIQPLLDGIKQCLVQRLPQYPAGSWGPKEADALMEVDGRRWMLVRRPTGTR